MASKYLLLIIFLFSALESYSQDGSIDTVVTPDGKMHIQKSAGYPGGTAGLQQDVVSNFKYPKKAVRDKVQGSLVLQFTIDTTGNITGASVLKGLRKDVDEAALKSLEKLEKFKPAMMDGKNVPLTIRLPLNLKL